MSFKFKQSEIRPQQTCCSAFAGLGADGLLCVLGVRVSVETACPRFIGRGFLMGLHVRV